MDNKYQINLGERIRKLRKERNFSQEELGFRANLHRTYIGMIERAEKNIIMRALEKHNGNITKAADELGISRPTLHELIRKHGIKHL